MLTIFGPEDSAKVTDFALEVLEKRAPRASSTRGRVLVQKGSAASRFFISFAVVLPFATLRAAGQAAYEIRDGRCGRADDAASGRQDSSAARTTLAASAFATASL